MGATITGYHTLKEEYSKELIGCKEYVALALEAARKSMTLMKNEVILYFCNLIYSSWKINVN